MRLRRWIALSVVSSSLLFAGTPEQSKQKKAVVPPASEAQPNGPDSPYSGMYSFLREGEFVQLTVEQGELSGFVSRMGDLDSDRGVFLDQFFDKGKIKGNQVSFVTKPVH